MKSINKLQSTITGLYKIGMRNIFAISVVVRYLWDEIRTWKIDLRTQYSSCSTTEL